MWLLDVWDKKVCEEKDAEFFLLLEDFWGCQKFSVSL